jgi:hypothetical protein
MKRERPRNVKYLCYFHHSYMNFAERSRFIFIQFLSCARSYYAQKGSLFEYENDQISKLFKLA